jgi:hypothetical protein
LLRHPNCASGQCSAIGVPKPVTWQNPKLIAAAKSALTEAAAIHRDLRLS